MRCDAYFLLAQAAVLSGLACAQNEAPPGYSPPSLGDASGSDLQEPKPTEGNQNPGPRSRQINRSILLLQAAGGWLGSLQDPSARDRGRRMLEASRRLRDKYWEGRIGLWWSKTDPFPWRPRPGVHDYACTLPNFVPTGGGGGGWYQPDNPHNWILVQHDDFDGGDGSYRPPPLDDPGDPPSGIVSDLCLAEVLFHEDQHATQDSRKPDGSDKSHDELNDDHKKMYESQKQARADMLAFLHWLELLHPADDPILEEWRKAMEDLEKQNT